LIAETYLGPNRNLRDIEGMLAHESIDPLRQFSIACREELQSRAYSGSTRPEWIWNRTDVP